MSKLSNLIFHNARHYISSPYGYRKVLNTSKGATRPFHDGVDYATYSVKLNQYPIDNGVILSCGTDWKNAGAKYVWVSYPRLGVKMLHYHLDSIKVKKGQIVTTETVIGKTGKTGRATGVHLHLGLKKLTGNTFIDPEAWFKEYYTEPKPNKKDSKDFLPERGYFKQGDVSPNIGKIAKFMRENFPSYTNKKALGNTYGKYLVKAIKEFQKRTGLEADGNIGAITLAKLVDYGFEY
jgi:murein DD-endopeptidase MepM/ murein hydrolase activator NlpD